MGTKAIASKNSVAQIIAWLESPEGHQAISDSKKCTKETCRTLSKARQVPRNLLHVPMSDFPHPYSPTLSLE